jgi:GNAT superfamily N-acetyltransferase
MKIWTERVEVHMENQDYLSYTKVVNLGESHRVLLRLLNKGDRDGFAELVQEASPEDALFLKQDFRDPETLDQWFDRLNYRLILPLVAVDLDRHRFAAVAILQLGKQALRYVGDIRLLIAESYRRLGLSSLLLGELIDLAWKEDLYWLAAEVPWEQRQVVKAFEARGFQIKARLPERLRRPGGVTRDVVLLMLAMLKREEEV